MCDKCSNCQSEDDSGSGLLFGLIVGAIIGAVVAIVLYHQDKDKILAQFRKWLEKLTSPNKPIKVARIRHSAPSKFKK